MIRSFATAIGMLVAAASHVYAGPAGEIRRLTSDPSASCAMRSIAPEVLVTIWYAAAPDVIEHEVTIGPPSGKPLFDAGSVALNAAFTPGEDQRRVVLWHATAHRGCSGSPRKQWRRQDDRCRCGVVAGLHGGSALCIERSRAGHRPHIGL